MTAAAAEPVPSGRARRLRLEHVDVLRLSANGHTTARIAALLGLSETTVINYWKTIRRLLGVQSAPQAVAVAMVLGLVRAEDVSVPSSAGRTGVRVGPVSRDGLPGALGTTGGPS